MSGFPDTFEAFECELESGGGYGSGLPRETDATHQFYADGHPHVTTMRVATYRLVDVREVPVDSSPEAKQRWRERNPGR